jgi:anti-anti-sigma factor
MSQRGLNASSESSANLRTVIDRTGGRAVIVVQGEIDIGTAAQFADVVSQVEADAGCVEIDLRETTFMDSSGLAVLMAAHQRLGQARESIVLHDPPANIRRLLEITGVDQFVDVRDTSGHPDPPPTPER